MAASIVTLFPGAAYQHCVLQFYRRVLSLVPLAQLPAVEDLLKGIHACADRDAAHAEAVQVAATLCVMALPAVATAVEANVEQTLGYYAFPVEHWRSLRSNYLLNRIMREIRERTRVVGAFSDGQSAVLLVSARLRHIAGEMWARRYHMDMGHLRGLPDAGARIGAA